MAHVGGTTVLARRSAIATIILSIMIIDNINIREIHTAVVVNMTVKAINSERYPWYISYSPNPDLSVDQKCY